MTHKPAPRAWRLAAVVLGLAAAGSPPFRLEAAQQGEPRVLQRAWTVDGAAVGSPATDDSSAYFLSKSHEVLAIDAASGLARKATLKRFSDCRSAVMSCMAPDMVTEVP